MLTLRGVARTGLGVLFILAALAGQRAAADDPPKSDQELHVVGLYEGATRTGGEIHGPRRASRSIVLASA